MAAQLSKEKQLSEKRTYRKFTAKQKAEIVLAGLRGDRSVRDVCRDAGIAETLVNLRRGVAVGVVGTRAAHPAAVADRPSGGRWCKRR